MKIFDHLIANDMVKGITALETKDRDGTLQFECHILLNNHPRMTIVSPKFGVEDEAVKQEWLKEYHIARRDVGFQIGEAVSVDPSHQSQVEDTYNSLKLHLDKVFEKLAPKGPTLNDPVNTHIERIHIESKKLMELALK